MLQVHLSDFLCSISLVFVWYKYGCFAAARELFYKMSGQAVNVEVATYAMPVFDPESCPADWDLIPTCNPQLREYLKPIISPREYGMLYLSVYTPLFQVKEFPFAQIPIYSLTQGRFSVMSDAQERAHYTRGLLVSIKNLSEKEKMIKEDRESGELAHRVQVGTSLFNFIASRLPEVVLGYVVYHSTSFVVQYRDGSEPELWRTTIFLSERSGKPEAMVYRKDDHVRAVEFMVANAKLERFARGCGQCGRFVERGGLSTCRCGQKYCSVDCQRAHWGAHKTVCQTSEAQDGGSRAAGV